MALAVLMITAAPWIAFILSHDEKTEGWNPAPSGGKGWWPQPVAALSGRRLEEDSPQRHQQGMQDSLAHRSPASPRAAGCRPGTVLGCPETRGQG